ncbi:alpha/beta hydrolase [Asticcacaulis sp. AC402]|uniref:alpha/beta hydrolase n=1 Tax=Asticcacaulis sp. AC402 TaxID=1282361 RepID=UPI0003C3FDAC|nr:alpha/beta hydrolase [Asticcacaulis sp. AC402]ESQ77435.1 endo-1,4-beta-xylanase [Asticcacaulis sp. AC402]
MTFKAGLLAVFALLFSALPATAQEVVYLWDRGQPGFEARKDIPEQHAEWWWRSINNPSLTVLRPDPAKASRAAVIVVPGGGHRDLVFGEEGLKPAQYLQSQGVTAFALKYVLAREPGSPYSIQGDAQADLLRAIRYVRAHAADYDIDPDKIGVMGFSAGGELTSLVSFTPQGGTPNAADPIDRIDARPDFLIEIYPGPLGIPTSLDRAPPPAFFLSAYDDPMAVADFDMILKLYKKYPEVPYELHVLSGDGHGFNMGDRSKRKAVRDWPARLADWLTDMGYLAK